MSLRCYLFGHKMKWRDEGSADIGAASKCVRCGHEVPAVVWPRTGSVFHSARPIPIIPQPAPSR